MIRLSVPDVRDSDISSAVEVLRSGFLVQGPRVLRLEEALSDFTGIPYWSAVSSGTAALHLTLLALGVKAGHSVLVPAFTFPATANVAEAIGGKLALCDVDPKRYVVTADRVAKALETRSDIRAIMVVHEFGQPAETAKIASLAGIHGIPLIEDAACALGSLTDGKAPGSYSAAACYSFHPRKALTTGEGGAVSSTDPGLIQRVKRLRNHGIQPNANGGPADFVDAGLNYRMTDFQAALGNAQLPRFQDELAKRRELVARYRLHLGGTPGVRLPTDQPGHSWQTFMIVLGPGIDREAVRIEMRKRGIECGLGAQALNCLTYFQRKYHFSGSDFPNATELFRQGLALPLHGRLSVEDIDDVCGELIRSLGIANAQ